MMIKDAVISLIKIVDELKKEYPKKNFTLDGRLVGDLGGVFAEDNYYFKLDENLKTKNYGKSPDGKIVHINTTMQYSLRIPKDAINDYYIGIKINKNGSFEEIYNGPLSLVYQNITAKPSNNSYTIPIDKLRELNSKVDLSNKIKIR